MRDTVWIPAVPLPLIGWRTDRCYCGAKFSGRGRRERYEIHYRHEHEPGSDRNVLMEVSRAEADRIYALVREGEQA